MVALALQNSGRVLTSDRLPVCSRLVRRSRIERGWPFWRLSLRKSVSVQRAPSPSLGRRHQQSFPSCCWWHYFGQRLVAVGRHYRQFPHSRKPPHNHALLWTVPRREVCFSWSASFGASRCRPENAVHYPAQRMTPIEKTLFFNGTAHWVLVFLARDQRITVTLHPWDRPDLLTHATFEHSKMLSIDDTYADNGDFSLPWDIIGFDSEPVSANRWRYCLHTDKIEYCFEANWPAVRRAG